MINHADHVGTCRISYMLYLFYMVSTKRNAAA